MSVVLFESKASVSKSDRVVSLFKCNNTTRTLFHPLQLEKLTFMKMTQINKQRLSDRNTKDYSLGVSRSLPHSAESELRRTFFQVFLFGLKKLPENFQFCFFFVFRLSNNWREVLLLLLLLNTGVQKYEFLTEP